MRSSFNGWLREVSLWLLVGCGMYLMLALVTYTPLDPGWSYVGPQDVVIKNAGGVLGAWCADVFTYLIGYAALLFPMALIWFALLNLYMEDVRLSRRAHVLPLQWLGFLITVVAIAALADLYVRVHPSLMPSGPGGVLGQFAASSVILYLKPLGGILSLVFLAVFGFTILTNFPWLDVVGFIGRSILLILGWLIWPILFLVPKGHIPGNTEDTTVVVDEAKNEPVMAPEVDVAVENADSSVESTALEPPNTLADDGSANPGKDKLVDDTLSVPEETTSDNALLPLNSYNHPDPA